MQTSARSQARRLLTLPALGLLILVLIPISAICDLIWRLRSTRKVGTSRDLPRVAASQVSMADLIHQGRPVIIEGLTDSLGVRSTPDLSSLRALAATSSETFPVRFYDVNSPYFLYTGDYGAELDHSSRMTLEEFLDFVFDSDATSQLCAYQLFGSGSLNGSAGAFIDDVADGLAEVVDRRPDKSVSGIWIGSKGVTTPLHHDAWTGLLFQFHGTKRVLMYAPADRPNLYFTSPFSVGDRWTGLPGRSGDADPVEFPRFAKATPHEGILESGDALFIPPFWSHEIEALESNISMPFRFEVKPVERLNPGYLRPAYETFHRKYLAERGARK